MTLTVNIIGAGQVGQTLGHLLVKHQLVGIAGICNRTASSTKAAIQFIGAGLPYSTISALPSADLTLITTPDDLLPQCTLELANNPSLKPDSIILHCSGILSSDALKPLSAKGCLTASVHPMRSFAKPALSVQEFKGTYCALEGDKAALLLLGDLFEQMGAITYELDKSKKSTYHPAAVFASNYLITLSQQALTCLQKAGVEKNMAMQIITNLMKGAVSNLEHTLSPEESLTGPIRRGDVLTLEKHMAALEGTQRTLYSVMGKATIDLTSHDNELKELLEKALTRMVLT